MSRIAIATAIGIGLFALGVTMRASRLERTDDDVQMLSTPVQPAGATPDGAISAG